MPSSLKKIQTDITKEFATSNIAKINLNITNYRKETSDVEYQLTSTEMPPQCTVTQAKEIVDKHLKEWKTNRV